MRGRGRKGRTEDGEYEHAERLHTLLAGRVGVDALPVSLLDVVRGSEDDLRRVGVQYQLLGTRERKWKTYKGREEVHRRVDGRGDERHRVREEDDTNLGTEKEDVDGEVEVDSDWRAGVGQRSGLRMKRRDGERENVRKGKRREKRTSY